MSSSFDELIAEVSKDLPARVEFALFPRERHWKGLTYQASPYTRKEFLNALRLGPQLRVVVNELHSRVSSAALSFAAEVFARVFFPSTPRVAPPDPAFGWAAAYHDQLSAVPAFKRYQRMYSMDSAGAGVAALHLLQAFLDALPNDNIRQDYDPNAEPPEPEEELITVDPDDPDAEEVIQRAKDALEEFRKRQHETQKAAQAAGKDLLLKVAGNANFGNQIGNAMDEAAAQQRADRDLFAGLGIPDDSSGSTQVVSPTIKAAIAQKVRATPRLQKITLMAGRMRRIAGTKVQGSPGAGFEEVASIEQGNDIIRVVPSQLLGLVDPDFESKFDKDWSERKLMQYRLESRPPKGRGPIVFCIDVSGSMEGDRDIWAKALFAGVAEVALRQRRWCTAIQFDNRVQRVDTFDPRKLDPVHFLECVGFFSGGGTNFSRPLDRALDIIGEGGHFAKADIIFLTDGDAYHPENEAKRLREMQTKNPVNVHGIVVGGDASGDSLKGFCDEITVLPDLLNGGTNAAEKLYGKLA